MAELRGSFVGEHGDGEQRFIKRFLAAAVVQAIKDAQRGDPAAAEWLAGQGATWAEDMLGISPEVLATWPQVMGSRRGWRRGGALTNAERCKRWYEKHKHKVSG